MHIRSLKIIIFRQFEIISAGCHIAFIMAKHQQKGPIRIKPDTGKGWKKSYIMRLFQTLGTWGDDQYKMNSQFVRT